MDPRNLKIIGHAQPASSVARAADFIGKDQAGKVVRTFYAPFYDTVLMPAVSGGTIASGRLQFFTTGQGNSGTTDPVYNTGTKDWVSTNLQTSGGIFPQGQAFKSDSMGIAVFPAIISSAGNYGTATTAFTTQANDILAVCFGQYVTVGGGTTVIPIGTVAHWPAGYGITGVLGGVSTANGVTQYGSAMNNGVPQKTSRNMFENMPIAFNSTQSFQVIVQTTQAIQQNGATRWDVQVAWWGIWTDTLGG